ncbi:DoxX family protein [Mumia sp. zg.B21]|uniref:DoxX family protein n=1 Tax=Mumia sp. zg.B21 TaxID=2855447 RepID=UPI0021078EAF|nr:DoxX family protein [Mumia sp. zg.B21]
MNLDMNVVLWIATGLLALVAVVGGVTKTFIPKERLTAQRGGEWTADASVGFVKTLGVVELLAAVGLIVPAVVGIAPVLAPVTAACWVVLMVGAMITHGRLGQPALVALTGFYLAIAAFIAWGRFGDYPLVS